MLLEHTATIILTCTSLSVRIFSFKVSFTVCSIGQSGISENIVYLLYDDFHGGKFQPYDNANCSITRLKLAISFINSGFFQSHAGPRNAVLDHKYNYQ